MGEAWRCPPNPTGPGLGPHIHISRVHGKKNVHTTRIRQSTNDRKGIRRPARSLGFKSFSLLPLGCAEYLENFRRYVEVWGTATHDVALVLKLCDVSRLLGEYI